MIYPTASGSDYTRPVYTRQGAYANPVTDASGSSAYPTSVTRSRVELIHALKHLSKLEKTLDSARNRTASGPATVSGAAFSLAAETAGNARLGSSGRMNATRDISRSATFDGSVKVQRQRLQAENATLSGSAKVYTVHAGYDGTGFVGSLTSTGAGLAMSASVGTAGSYDIDLQYAAGNNGPATDRTMSLYVNGSRVRQLTFARTGDWSSYASAAITAVDLDAGANSIELRVDAGDTGYINPDYIELDDGSGSLPTAQAEDFDARSGNPYVTTSGDGYDGAAYVGGLNTQGYSVSLTTDAAFAGAHDVGLRYAAGGSDTTDRTISIYVNGTKARQLTLAHTGGWTDWAQAVTSLDLSVGENSIMVRHDSGDTGGINLDYISGADVSKAVPGFESGRVVSAGSFTVNGVTIDVFADDSVDDVVARIDASAAGVSASLDVANQTVEIVSDVAGSSSNITLGNDTSGFLQATRLDDATMVPGQAAIDSVLADLDHFDAVSSGSIQINGQSIAFDIQNDSVQDVLNAINAADAGVTSSLTETAGAWTVELQGGSSGLTIDDGGTGLFAALGIGSGSYGSSGSGGEPTVTDRATRIYSYRAADILDDFHRALDTLISADGGNSFEALIGPLFEEMAERFGSDKLRKPGLDFEGDGWQGIELGKIDRQRFTQAIQRGDDTLVALLLGGSGAREGGLLESLQDLLKDEIKRRNGGSSRGALFEAYA